MKNYRRSVVADTYIKQMSIQEIVESNPETIQIFGEFGMGCIGCAMANFETVEEGAMAHGINIDELMKALNEKAGKQKSSDGACNCCG